jgi:hypothetical protein
MLRRWRFRRAGWLSAIGALAAMAATMVVAAPGGAAAPEKVYSASFEMACIVGPGSLNIRETLNVSTHAKGPETLTHGEAITFKEAQSTITAPVNLSESFQNLGATEAGGMVRRFVLNGTGLEPTELNIAKPAEFTEGLPYRAPVEAGKETMFVVPSLAVGEITRTYTLPSETASGANGTEAVSEVDHSAGFEENTETGFKSTRKGIQSTTQGFNASGESVVGPVPVSCSAPAGVVLARIPIGGPPTTTTTTTTEGVHVKFQNWKLEGSLTDKKQGQTINLPEGCTFNGEAEEPGPLEGNTFCPPFTASLKLLGFLPTSLGVDLIEAGAVKGSITPAGGGSLTFKATAKDNLAITSIGIFGLRIPTNCSTVEPIVFPLEATGPSSALATGETFNGETTLPAVNCSGGLLGPEFGLVITSLLSGPNNPFTFKIHP